MWICVDLLLPVLVFVHLYDYHISGGSGELFPAISNAHNVHRKIRTVICYTHTHTSQAHQTLALTPRGFRTPRARAIDFRGKYLSGARTPQTHLHTHVYVHVRDQRRTAHRYLILLLYSTRAACTNTHTDTPRTHGFCVANRDDAQTSKTSSRRRRRRRVLCLCRSMRLRAAG